MSSKSLHRTICTIVAIASTGSVLIWQPPICLGCLSVQALLWLRLFLQSKYKIGLCLLAILIILGALWYSAAYAPLICPFDLTTATPSCSQFSSVRIAGLPFAAWGFLGTTGLLIWVLFWDE
jgi:hypothetical protein